MNIIDLSKLKGLVVVENTTENTENIAEIAENTPIIPEKKLRIWREKQKGGRTATLIKGFENSMPNELLRLTQILKTKLATGGAVKDGGITLQGDVGTAALNILTSLGHSAKKAGG